MERDRRVPVDVPHPVTDAERLVLPRDFADLLGSDLSHCNEQVSFSA
jgi:hypothetical protein